MPSIIGLTPGSPASSLPGWTESVQDTVAGMLVAGSGVTLTYNDAANTLTVASTATGGSTDAEIVRDTIASALVAGSGVTIVPNDGADTITITATGGGSATTDASALTTGTLPAARIADGSVADVKLASGTKLAGLLAYQFTVLTSASATRPAGLPAGWARYVCPTQPTTWLAGDEWVNNS
jgi:hypothetical protein